MRELGRISNLGHIHHGCDRGYDLDYAVPGVCIARGNYRDSGPADICNQHTNVNREPPHVKAGLPLAKAREIKMLELAHFGELLKAEHLGAVVVVSEQLEAF